MRVEFGSRRLAHTLLHNRKEPVSALPAKVFHSLDSFRGDQQQHDDQTIVAIEYKGIRKNLNRDSSS
jgi:serine phosphatase RsbU (regulator of sigma subunit)